MSFFKKLFKTILPIAAAIAIPFVAPVIAASSFLAPVVSAIGMTGTSALVGAGLGAASAGITGGDVGRGALIGGIGGGIGGYNYTPASAVTPAMQQTISGAPQGAFLGEGVASGVPAWDAAATAAGVPLTTPATVGLAIPAYTPTVSTPGVTGMQGAFLGEGVASGVPSWDAAATRAGVPLMTPTTVGPALPPSAPEPFSQAVSQVAPVAPVAPTPTAAAKPTTFAEALKQVPAAIADKFKDPAALADMTLRAGGVLAGSLLAGTGLSDEEQRLLDAQVEEMRNLQQQNQALFNQRLEQAQALVGESKYFDPEYFGLQRARRAQIAGARAKRAGLRGLTGASREAAERQFDLATGRDVGTAFDQGFGTGVQGRLQTMQTGLQLMPQEYPSMMGAYGNIRSAYESAARRRDDTAGRIGDLFGSITGSSQARRPG